MTGISENVRVFMVHNFKNIKSWEASDTTV